MSAAAEIVTRKVTAAEWDETLLAIAEELTNLGRQRLDNELFVRRIEFEVRELTGLRGLVSDDLVSDLLLRAQSLLGADSPGLRDAWLSVDEPALPTPAKLPRQWPSGVRPKRGEPGHCEDDEDTVVVRAFAGRRRHAT